MSTVAATPVKKTAKKTAKKTTKKVVKKVTKKLAKKAVKKTVKKADKSRTTTEGLTVEERQTQLIKAMKKSGANSAGTACTAKVLAEKAGLTEFDVYCLCYHKNQLVTNGLVKIAKLEGVRGLSYYLTVKGSKTE